MKPSRKIKANQVVFTQQLFLAYIITGAKDKISS